MKTCNLGYDCPDGPHGGCCGEPAIPDRIWAWEIDHLTSPPNGYYSVEEVDDATLFVRADLAQAPDAALMDELVEALRGLHHAVCGETGFAACVRQDSGKAYPWPALDAADEAARAAIARHLAPGNDNLDEQFDTQMEVERNPCGAWMAIQSQAARLSALTAERDEARKSHGEMVRIFETESHHHLAAEAEAATLRDRLARIAGAWPLVRDTDCSGGELASAIDEIDAALTDGGSK